MKMKHFRKIRDERGQAIVELALVLPVVLLLVVGILEFARAWNIHQALTDAVREGARRAAIADTVMNRDSVRAAIWRGLQQAGYDPSQNGTDPTLTNSVTITGNWKTSGQSITVDTRIPYKIWAIGNRGFTMQSTFTMRNE